MADLSKLQCTMKRILILLLALMPMMVAGQNFSIEKGSTVWKKVYSKDIPISTIASQMTQSGKFMNISQGNDFVSADIKPELINIEGLGYNRMSVPMYLSASSFSGHVIIQCKEGRYRAVVSSMVFVGNYTSNLFEQGESTSINTYFVKGNEFKKNAEKAMNVVNKHLDKMFTFTNSASITDDEW